MKKQIDNKGLPVILLMVFALTIGIAAVAVAADPPPPPEPQPAPEVEELREQAREALNREKFRDAAKLYSELYQMNLEQKEAGNALYWEAFARYRLERTSELKKAEHLLQLLQESYSMAETAAEGEALAARINGELARRGEARAARRVRERADDDDMREETRSAALQALMHMDPERAIPLLKKIVLDASPENRDLRRNAVFMLCHQDDTEAEDMLIGLLETETDTEFLSEIVMCLSMRGSDRSLAALMELFRRTDDPELSEAALLSIGHHGGDEVFAFLKGIVGDTQADPEVRGQALMALSMTDREDEVAPLLAEILRTEKDDQILEMALFSLSRLDSEEAGDMLLGLVKRRDVDEELRAQALFFAAGHDRVDLDLLREVYQSTESRDMKQQVCHILTQMGDDEAGLDLLIDIARNEEDPEIRRDAVFWIGQFDNDKAAEFLLEVINRK